MGAVTGEVAVAKGGTLVSDGSMEVSGAIKAATGATVQNDGKVVMVGEGSLQGKIIGAGNVTRIEAKDEGEDAEGWWNMASITWLSSGVGGLVLVVCVIYMAYKAVKVRHRRREVARARQNAEY